MKGSLRAGANPQKFGSVPSGMNKGSNKASYSNPTQPGAKTGSKFPTGSAGQGSTQANVPLKS